MSDKKEIIEEVNVNEPNHKQKNRGSVSYTILVLSVLLAFVIGLAIGGHAKKDNGRDYFRGGFQGQQMFAPGQGSKSGGPQEYGSPDQGNKSQPNTQKQFGQGSPNNQDPPTDVTGQVPPNNNSQPK